MNHISIEGFDGVGKTTICKLLAETLNYKFVEKPLHYLYSDDGKIDFYQKMAKKVNANPNRIFTAWYYGLNNIYLYDLFKNDNIVTDRHIVSNYCWSGTKENLDIYELIIKKIGKPRLTVILYAPKETIETRLKTRNAYDNDLKKLEFVEEAYEKMIYFSELMKLPYIVIDTKDLEPKEIVDQIIKKLGE